MTRPDSSASARAGSPALDGFFSDTDRVEVTRSTRPGFWQHLGNGVAAAIAGLTRATGGDRLRVTEVAVQSANWPEGKPPLRIAVLADFHVGSPTMPPERMRAIVAETNRQKPDVVLLVGDFVNQEENLPPLTAGWANGTVTHPDEIGAILGQLKAPGGVHAVLGNHEFYSKPVAGMMERALRRNGIGVLRNEAVPVEAAGQRFWVAGVADRSDGPDHAPIAATVGKDPHILMAHNPVNLLDAQTHPGVMVAGHTHGGQVGVPGLGWFSRLPLIQRLAQSPRITGPLREVLEHLAAPQGHRQDPQGRDHYVTAGLGTSTVPLRANMRPEIAMLTLTGKPKSPGQ